MATQESQRGKPTTGGGGGGGSEAATEVWTTRRLLKWMAGHFDAKGLDSSQKIAQMLLSHVIGCERMRLFMEADRPASKEELATLRDLVARAVKHEPVQYLVGHEWFFSRQFEVDRSTLIPRPCTETLVEHVLQWLRTRPGGVAASSSAAIDGEPASLAGTGLLLADIGTGTGCIAVSLAAQLPGARIVATDIAPGVLELAKRNAAKHKVDDRIEFRLGVGLDPLKVGGPNGRKFDVICSNPPYIPDHEWEAVEPNVKDHEPATALRGGNDGLDVIRPLIQGAPLLLASGGLLAVEIADCQKDAVLELARAAGFSQPTVLKDHEDLWRVLVAERAAVI